MMQQKAPLVDIEEIGQLCSFYEGFQSKSDSFMIPKGVYTLDDLKDFGREKGMCPYFLARHYLLHSNIIVYNYSYMLDPKIANLVSKELQRDSIVVFDECHNIDNACIEAFSMNLNRKSLELASANLKKLEEIVKVEKLHNTRRLTEEYNRLVRGLFNMENGGNKIVVSEKELMQHPLLEQDVLKEAVPGSIRKAEHFLSFLRRVLVCLKEKLNTEGRV
jgi:DNA excision repair protein ERCC-2